MRGTGGVGVAGSILDEIVSFKRIHLADTKASPEYKTILFFFFKK